MANANLKEKLVIFKEQKHQDQAIILEIRNFFKQLTSVLPLLLRRCLPLKAFEKPVINNRNTHKNEIQFHYET